MLSDALQHCWQHYFVDMFVGVAYFVNPDPKVRLFTCFDERSTLTIWPAGFPSFSTSGATMKKFPFLSNTGPSAPRRLSTIFENSGVAIIDIMAIVLQQEAVRDWTPDEEDCRVGYIDIKLYRKYRRARIIIIITVIIKFLNFERACNEIIPCKVGLHVF